ncbi:DUF397 domain-containing protein [Amycolatopsis sp. H20-H5]|uniref:DUF397 domain-containing protein n=1 Tax=Amycolatopsis sp. H20-H5 TaxID=3046309 RepID=UPI002DBDFC0C|nr:DUF397 domain-containing protein [Amycolatopsis sp. H20-H5]MEC3979586.1 DUF397 domain-containing protein [Amycolatopsis sp. H20-H5]
MLAPLSGRRCPQAVPSRPACPARRSLKATLTALDAVKVAFRDLGLAGWEGWSSTGCVQKRCHRAVAPDAVGIRDSKAPAGELAVGSGAWAAFLARVRR